MAKISGKGRTVAKSKASSKCNKITQLNRNVLKCPIGRIVKETKVVHKRNEIIRTTKSIVETQMKGFGKTSLSNLRMMTYKKPSKK